MLSYCSIKRESTVFWKTGSLIKSLNTNIADFVKRNRRSGTGGFGLSVNGGQNSVAKPLDFVFQKQLASFQFAEPQLVGSGMGKLFVDFTL